MCGIAGFTRFHTSPGNETTLRKMGDAIAHRGPDASGEYLDSEIGLCHRRLSIIDLSTAGNQPMFSSDGNLVIVFNGEIYNFLDLRKELLESGYRFRTKTDTEVILALYEREGSDMLSKLNGMFAIALWDKRAKSLFLARDRIGKKPLYYYDDGNNFIFGSEIKALLATSVVNKRIRQDALYDYFAYQYIPDPKTIYQNLYKLEPGHWIRVTRHGVEKKKYWDVSFGEIRADSESELKDQLYEIIGDCVKRRMISDVPLGAFLSGGVDSSAVVGLMAEQSNGPVTTCSIGFDSKLLDEVEFARIVARKFETSHHEFVVHDNMEEHLPGIAGFFDEPFADESLVPTYFVSKLARQKVTVALAGDGGDEVFSGYEKYSVDRYENRLRRFFPRGLRNSLYKPLSNLLYEHGGKTARRGSSLLDSLSASPAYGFYLSNAQFNDRLWSAVINEDLRKAIGDYHPSIVTTDFYDQADTEDHLSKILYADMKTYLPGDILVKVDRMSMANSLEVRAPLLDYKLVEFAAGIPSRLKFRGREKKYILKESMKRLLPNEILYRRKMGFSVPLDEWFRGGIRNYAQKQIFDSHGGISDFFNLEVVRKIWDQHQSGSHNHSVQLLSFLMFQLWWKRYL
jgi:asparagine synthase (glutamine-hydrolysing)